MFSVTVAGQMKNSSVLPSINHSFNLKELIMSALPNLTNFAG